VVRKQPARKRQRLVIPAASAPDILQSDTAGKSVLHLFGGRSTFGFRMDVDPIVRPDLIGDAWLPPFRRESFDVVILDPPYFTMNAQVKTGLFRAAGYIARERVIWFATQWQAASGGLRAEKAYLVRVGDSCQVRCLQYFTIAERFDGKPRPSSRGPAMKYNRWIAQPQMLPFSQAEASVSGPGDMGRL
jgi:hypothetical protein